MLAKPLNPACIEQMARKTQRKYRKQLFNGPVVARHIQAGRPPDFLCNTLCPPSLPLPLFPSFVPSLPILLLVKLPRLKAHSAQHADICLLSLFPILTVWVISQPACPTLGNPSPWCPSSQSERCHMRRVSVQSQQGQKEQGYSHNAWQSHLLPSTGLVLGHSLPDRDLGLWHQLFSLVRTTPLPLQRHCKVRRAHLMSEACLRLHGQC